MYDRIKINFRNNDHFEGFWTRKLAPEPDGDSWTRFKTVVTEVWEHISLLDRTLGTMNNVRTFEVLSESSPFLLLVRSAEW